MSLHWNCCLWHVVKSGKMEEPTGKTEYPSPPHRSVSGTGISYHRCTQNESDSLPKKDHHPDQGVYPIHSRIWSPLYNHGRRKHIMCITMKDRWKTWMALLYYFVGKHKKQWPRKIFVMCWALIQSWTINRFSPMVYRRLIPASERHTAAEWIRVWNTRAIERYLALVQFTYMYSMMSSTKDFSTGFAKTWTQKSHYSVEFIYYGAKQDIPMIDSVKNCIEDFRLFLYGNYCNQLLIYSKLHL